MGMLGWTNRKNSQYFKQFMKCCKCIETMALFIYSFRKKMEQEKIISSSILLQIPVEIQMKIFKFLIEKVKTSMCYTEQDVPYYITGKQSYSSLAKVTVVCKFWKYLLHIF